MLRTESELKLSALVSNNSNCPVDQSNASVVTSIPGVFAAASKTISNEFGESTEETPSNESQTGEEFNVESLAMLGGQSQKCSLFKKSKTDGATRERARKIHRVAIGRSL